MQCPPRLLGRMLDATIGGLGLERGMVKGELPHDMAWVLQSLDLGDHAPMVLLLGRPERVRLRHGEADKGEAGPVLDIVSCVR